MNLLSSLNSGFLGAANGWAEIYVRGTNTRATWYPDFEASSSNSSGSNITLDAYGSAEVYVNQLVNVVVKDSDGVLVREYTDGYSSPNIEVKSQSFTGIDYVSAVAAAGNPTTLQAIEDLWITNSGAIDWKVLLNGSAQTLQVAIGGLSGLVYNVKNPAYGAVGDGVANDQSAIASALAAAVAAGGGIVFFPKGTYLITTAIEWDHSVSIWGVGAGVSVITNNSASNARTITWTTGTARAAPMRIFGMSFSASQSNTGEQLYSSVAVNLCIDGCQFGASANCTGDLINLGGASRARVLNSRFTVQNAKSALITSATTVALVEGCHIDTGTNYTGSMVKADGWVTVASTILDMTPNTTGATAIAVEAISSATYLTVKDCRLVPLTQIFSPCIKLIASAHVWTSGIDFSFQSTSTWYSALTASTLLAAGSSLQLYSNFHDAGGVTSETVPDAVAVAEYRLTSTVPTITAPKMYFPGQTLKILIVNRSGVNWVGNVTFNGFQPWGTVSTVANDGHAVFAEFTVAAMDNAAGTTFSWVGLHMKVDSP